MPRKKKTHDDRATEQQGDGTFKVTCACGEEFVDEVQGNADRAWQNHAAANTPAD